jgi:hypothetical protein
MNASGNFTSPFFIFPWQRNSIHPTKDGPCDAEYECTPNARTNNSMFVQWLKHFLNSWSVTLTILSSSFWTITPATLPWRHLNFAKRMAFLCYPYLHTLHIGYSHRTSHSLVLWRKPKIGNVICIWNQGTWKKQPLTMLLAYLIRPILELHQ